MSIKRKTKVQKDAAGIAALRQRLQDIALGANHGYEVYSTEESGELSAEIGIESFGYFVQAVNTAFHLSDIDNRKWMAEPRNLSYYESLDAAAAFLYENGVRA